MIFLSLIVMFVLHLILQVIDIGTTEYNIRKLRFNEANPLYRNNIIRLSIGCSIKFIAPIILFYIGNELMFETIITILFICFNVFYAILCVHNTIIINRYKNRTNKK